MNIKIFITALFLFFPAITAVYGMDSLENFSAALKSEVSEINDVSFNFIQQVFIAGSTDTVKAQVFYKRPNFFFVRYTSPLIQEIYFDGEELVTHTPRIRQATSQKAVYSDEILGVSVSLIYSPDGLDVLDRDHRLEFKDARAGTVFIKAVPLDRREYTEMIIEFDEKTLRPIKTAVTSPHASSVTRFENYRVNSGIEDEKFIFIPPDNVDFIRINN